MTATTQIPQRFVLVSVAALATVGGLCACSAAAEKTAARAVVSAAGRLQANEIAVVSNLPGRVDRILVRDGQSVRAGQAVAHLQIPTLAAERAEAYARHKDALFLAASAEADVLLRETEVKAAEVAVRQYESQFQAIVQRLSSAIVLVANGATSVQGLEDLRAEGRRAAAAAGAADAQLAAARVAVVAARLHAARAHTAVSAAAATIARVETSLADATLTSPRDGDVQSRSAEPGDVVPAGGRVLTLVDTANVSLTFTLPDAIGGVRVGDEARVVLDGLPQSVFRATIATVEDAPAAVAPRTNVNARQRPMCRVTVHLDPALVQAQVKHVKAAMSGVAWLRLDSAVPWPATLDVMEP